MGVNASQLAHMDEILHTCIHCGLCLPVCPTYALTRLEQSSPRGRIRLMRSVADGSLAAGEAFAGEMYFCLDCQACQTACPAGVRYGELVEEARNAVALGGLDTPLLRFVKKAFLRGVLSSARRTAAFGALLRAYHRTGLRDAVDESGILRLLPGRIAGRHAMLPRAEIGTERLPAFTPARGGIRRGTVAFLSGCIMDISYRSVHRDAIAVLSSYGYDVAVPPGQECCGSLHAHNGDGEGARLLARRNARIFASPAYDAIVIDSAGCGAFLKEYGKVLGTEEGRSVAAKTRDITEFLAGVPAPPLKPLALKATYHEACHLVHTQKVSAEPRRLIASIPGIELVELPEASWCCGSAGIYNVVRYDDAAKLLERKMENIASTGAGVVLAGNPGCHAQIEYGIRKFGLKMKVMHPVSLLRMALSGD